MTVPERQENPSLTLSASFGVANATAGADERSPPPTSSVQLQSHPHNSNDDHDVAEDDFEFTFVLGCTDGTPTSVTADELFSHGRILPAYPVFDRTLLLPPSEDNEVEGPHPEIPMRRLLIEEAASPSGSISSSSSEADDMGSVTARKHFTWMTRSAPQSPDRCRKSASAGTERRRSRLQDLFLGGRSHSDGKEKSVLLEASPARGKSPSAKSSRAKAAAGGGVGASRVSYGNGQAVTGPRRSFLPYRLQLFGLFTARRSDAFHFL
ncbi:hypothetical protein Cni_G09077 [Canna indica]|uniref:Uncharacterized protein n=1 Tax=Canna indica TaxID=4628 RepID=A0AAQ3K3A8_9LILI|nr:hypothetical protein Cni_G09077 [Canna indica]